MNKEEIDYGLAIEDLQRPDGLRELAKMQQENEQLKDNWNKLRDYLFNIRQRGFELQNLVGIKNIEPSIGILMIIEKMDSVGDGDSDEKRRIRETL